MNFEGGPYVNLATFCEQLIEDKSGVLSLIRVVDRMHINAQGPNAPEQMPPAQMNWFLILNFRAGTARGSHIVKIQPELPSGLKLDPISMSAHFEGGNRGVNIISRLDMKLEEPGVYWFWIFLEDQMVTKIPLEVIYSRVVTPTPPPTPSK
ncbi:MAG: hypothetical protein GY845_09655 [Planctomycetes bacterium]|nr:hypothetical protein [Planctomycetota bacterium]